MLNKPVLALLSYITLSLPALTTMAGNPMTGPYLGQAPPGNEPALFAPGVVSDGFNNRDVAMMPDGSELYYAVNMRAFDLSTIMAVYQVNGEWSKPEAAPFATDKSMKFLEPAISPDGSRFFFVSVKRGGDKNMDVWVMDREGSSWGEPKKLGESINTPVSETFPSVTNDGTLYFSRASEDPKVEHIYRSRLVDGHYTEAEKLPDNVNCGKTQFNPFVAPDESYVIVSVWGRDDSIGSIDYYIIYRNNSDEWSEPVNMGPKINTPGVHEYSSFVSRDGKYLFFMSTRTPADDDPEIDTYSAENLDRIHNSPENGNSDIYWIDAGIIEELRPAGF
jgi:Tol biopolymer transport system component